MLSAHAWQETETCIPIDIVSIELDSRGERQGLRKLGFLSAEREPRLRMDLNDRGVRHIELYLDTIGVPNRLELLEGKSRTLLQR